MQQLQKLHGNLSNIAEHFSGLAPLLFRLILAPVMTVAGYSKLGMSSESASGLDIFLPAPEIVDWFGNAEWGLGLPLPFMLALLAAWTELIGGVLLFIGLLGRLVAVPLMFTMLVAASTVHLEHGWFAITPTEASTSSAQFYAALGVDAAKESLTHSDMASERLSKIRSILETHGYPDYLYEAGKPVLLNNGVEFAVMYFAMLLSIFFSGSGRYVSLDWWFWKRFSD